MDISPMLQKAREAVERRNYDYAIDLYLQLCKLTPNEGVPRKELRAVENRVAKERGVTFLQKAKAQTHFLKAQALHLAGKYDQAIEAAEMALKIDPGYIGAMALLGKSANAAKYYQATIAIFEDLRQARIGIDPKALTKMLRDLGKAYEETEDIEQAIEVWKQVNQLTAGNDREAAQKTRDLTAKMMTRDIQNKTAGARNEKMGMSKGIMRSTDFQKTKRDAAQIRTEDELKQALAEAQTEVKGAPDDPRGYIHLGDLWRRAENFEEAKRAFETAMAKDPNNPQHRFKLEDLEIWKISIQLAKLDEGGKAREGAGRAEYLEKKRKMLEYKMRSFLDRERLYSTDGRIKFDLANIFFELAEEMGEDGMYDEAIKRFQIVFPDPKFRNEAGLKMGTGFARKGQFDLALKRFDETLAKAGELKDLNWKTLMYAKGDTLEKAGKKNEAKEVFLAIYEVDVSFKDVSNRVHNLS